MCITLHDHLVCFQDSNNTKVMEFDSIHMYSHILVGAGQSVLYQCTQCVYLHKYASLPICVSIQHTYTTYPGCTVHTL